MRPTTAPASKPTPKFQGASKFAGDRSPSSVFIAMALDMSWKLALVVLLPIIGGAELDKVTKSSAYIIAGFVLAMIGMALIMWQTLQEANKMPVPKLSAAQKREIQKQYEEDDDDR